MAMVERKEDPSCDLYLQAMNLMVTEPLSRQRSEDFSEGFARHTKGNKLRIQRSTNIEISLLEDYLNEASELQNNGALEEAMLIHEKL